MVKDFRYIAKRVIIGILIGLFFIMFKSCNVNALEYIENATGYVYLQSQYCEQGDTITTTTSGSTRTGNRFSCTKGPSYKFVQLLNSDNNLSVPALFNEKQLINNFTFEINFEESQIITETNRYIVLRAPWLSSIVAEDKIGLLESFFTLNGIVNNNTITYSPSVSTYFNQPQYCSYSSSGNINKCNVYLVNDTSISRYVYYFDIPLGTSVDSISLFLGNNNIQSSYDLYTDVMVNNSILRAMTPTINRYYPNGCSTSSTNNTCYYGRFSSMSSYSHNNYNIYGSHINSGAGLIYYRYGPINPTFTPSNRIDNLWFNSSVPSNPIIYNFSSVSTDDVNYYNNLIGGIENELNPPSDEDDIQSNITNLLGSFATNEYTQSYLTTFDALLSYPIQKMRDLNNLDLVNNNVWTGTKQLDSKLCWGTDTVTGDVKNAYKVQFFRDYKFTLPCPHTDIYRHLGYGDYGFYPSNFMGAGNTGYTYNFISIWLVIQHGLLVYLLFVNVLNIYKYIIDSKKSEIEVLEL